MSKKEIFNLLLTKEVITATENTTILTLVKLMIKYNVGALIIMRGEKLAGILSERDIVRRVIGKKLPLTTTKAKDVMTKKVVTVELGEGFANIHQKLMKMKFRHLPIVHKGKLVGIASQRDIFSKKFRSRIKSTFSMVFR